MKKLVLRLFLILIIAAFAIWIDSTNLVRLVNPFNGTIIFERNTVTRLGLDLRGGLQVVLEADVPEGTEITAEQMDVARSIIESRTNALGVSENAVQVAGENRIVGEFPGLEDADAVLSIIQQTGQLEFVDFGSSVLPEGTIIQTYSGDTPPEDMPDAYHTIMTGAELEAVGVDSQPTTGEPVVGFTLTSKGASIFAEHTSTHQGQIVGIVLDKQVISSPRINEPITSGSGIIEGNFTIDSANALAIQLRYGSLPVPLKVVDTRYIGPTLGEDSLQKSSHCWPCRHGGGHSFHGIILPPSRLGGRYLHIDLCLPRFCHLQVFPLHTDLARRRRLPSEHGLCIGRQYPHFRTY